MLESGFLMIVRTQSRSQKAADSSSNTEMLVPDEEKMGDLLRSLHTGTQQTGNKN